jgi:ADP-ribose pyrophosphatase YjhB (NUDIX family)
MMDEQDTKLLISTLKEVLNLRLGYLHEQYEIEDPHDDPTGLCVNLSYLISKIEGGE